MGVHSLMWMYEEQEEVRYDELARGTKKQCDEWSFMLIDFTREVWHKTGIAIGGLVAVIED